MTPEEKIEDEFIDFWDSKKESLGLGNYSSDITYFWINKLQEHRKQALEEVREKIEHILESSSTPRKDIRRLLQTLIK
jgi:hypothetical protein